MTLSAVAGRRFEEMNLNGEDISGAMANFAHFIGIENLIPGRYSALLLLDLFGGYATRGLNPWKVLHEIRALETGAVSHTKPPSPFKSPPLKGLWHKHFLADSLASMAINLKKGVEQDGLPRLNQIARDLEQTGEVRYLTGEDIAALVDDAVIQNWIRLSQSSRLTGEWLIYAAFGDRNYYLCLGGHNRRGHPALRARIDSIARAEFPFLADILVDA